MNNSIISAILLITLVAVSMADTNQEEKPKAQGKPTPVVKRGIYGYLDLKYGLTRDLLDRWMRRPRGRPQGQGWGQSQNKGWSQSQNQGSGQSQNQGWGQSQSQGWSQSQNQIWGPSEGKGSGQSQNQGWGQSEGKPYGQSGDYGPAVKYGNDAGWGWKGSAGYDNFNKNNNFNDGAWP